VKRFLVVGFLLILGVVATLAFAQEEIAFLGNYSDARQVVQPKEETNQIVFARLIYNGQIPGYYKNWYTDYPKADRQLIQGLQRLTNLDIADHERAVAVTDPELFKYPFVYTSEPGQMVFNAQDAGIMREYLQRGGFWVLDDFWGSFEWDHMEAEMKKILPGAEIKAIRCFISSMTSMRSFRFPASLMFTTAASPTRKTGLSANAKAYGTRMADSLLSSITTRTWVMPTNGLMRLNIPITFPALLTGLR
jgi:hypothetical protein